MPVLVAGSRPSLLKAIAQLVFWVALIGFVVFLAINLSMRRRNREKEPGPPPEYL